MLTIRGIKASDSRQIADLIKKSPIGYRGYNNSDNKLKWSVNVFNPKLQNKRFIPSKYLEQQVKSPSNKGDFLVVEDNNKIIGVIRKYRGGAFANLYLNDKYYRRGIQDALISKVEQSFVKKIGNQIVTRPPYIPMPIFKKSDNKTFIPQSNNAPSQFVPKTFNK